LKFALNTTQGDSEMTILFRKPTAIRSIQRTEDYYQGRRQGGMRGLKPPLNGNRLNTNLLLTFVKT